MPEITLADKTARTFGLLLHAHYGRTRFCCGASSRGPGIGQTQHGNIALEHFGNIALGDRLRSRTPRSRFAARPRQGSLILRGRHRSLGSTTSRKTGSSHRRGAQAGSLEKTPARQRPSLFHHSISSFTIRLSQPGQSLAHGVPPLPLGEYGRERHAPMTIEGKACSSHPRS